MVWCRPGDKPLSEPMRVSLPTQTCVTRPHWDKLLPYWLWNPVMTLNLYFDMYIYIYRYIYMRNTPKVLNYVMCNKTNLYHNILSGILNMKINDNSCSIGILGRHQCPLMGFNTLKGFLIPIWRKAAHASRLLILCVVHFMGVAMLKVCVRNMSSTFNPCRSGFIYRDLIDKWYGM